MTTVSAILARAIGLVASLISVPLTFRYLGTERYGIWMVLTSIIAVMGFADLGIGNGLTNAVASAYGKEDRELAKEYVSSAFFLMTSIAACFAVAGLVAYPFIPWMRLFNVTAAASAVEGSKAFLVLYCWFVVNIPLGIVTRTQAGLQRGYSSQIVGALGNILSLLSLLFVIYLRCSLAWLVFASTFGLLVATLLNAWILFRAHPWLLPKWRAYRSPAAKKILKLGGLFFVLQCAVAVGFTSDNIVIAQVLGAAAVAAYAVPQKLFSVIPMVVAMGITPLWPAYGEAVARGDVAWVRRAFLGSMRITALIAIPVCSLLALAGPWILRVAVGKTLHAPLSLLIVLALWGVVSSMSSPIAMLLNGAGALRAQAIIAVIASVSNLALSIYLTRKFGVIGVCSGSIITQIVFTLPATLLLVRRVLTPRQTLSV